MLSNSRRITGLIVGTTLIAATVAARSINESRDRKADRAAVEKTALNYVEGFYEGDTAKLVASIRPEFYKYGFYRRNTGERYQGSQMTWKGALDYARSVKQNQRFAPANAIKKIEVLDLADQTASVKLTATWGIDYMLLARFDGEWMISHVLWQSPPPSGD